MTKEVVVWLGTPVDVANEELRSAYTSRIGGTGVLFRADTESKSFHCPKCKNSNKTSLLAQIYAPLDVYDRILYVFICAACSKEHKSFCFAIRSQNFNRIYITVEPHLEKAALEGEQEGALFEEHSDWGDACNDKWGETFEENGVDRKNENESVDSSVIVKPETKRGASHQDEEPSLLATLGSKLSVCGVRYPCFGLEIFEEPSKEKSKPTPVGEQLREAQKKYGEDVVDMTIEDEDHEPLHEKRVRKYVERIGRVPSQCVRWSPNDDPLRSSVVPIDVPKCTSCGSERRYELQLTSPIIYFLTKSKDEKNHSLHFGNVLVFTCAANCNKSAYALEYCVVEEEI